jgi:flavin-dependent dehydrogenase
MKTRFSLLTVLLFAPLASLHAGEHATFVREPRVVIQHGANDGRYFIGPGMFVLDDGSVLMAAPWGRPPANVFEGIVNKHPVPMLYRSTDAGVTWQELGRPEVKWRHSGFVSDGGVSFLRLQDGRIAMALHRHAAGLKGGALPVICFSGDEGKTWTDPVLIGEPGDEGAWYVMNDRLIQTRTGRLVLPVAHAVGRYEGDRDESLAFFSDDGGASWKRSQPAPLPDGPRGMAEPCVVELTDGRLLMLARGGLGVLVKSYSSDGGETWTPGARTTLVSPCSSLTLHRLPDSRLIVFYNHATPYNAGDFFPRNPLCYAISADEGDSWSGPVIIDNSGVSDGNGGKPSLQIVYPGAAFLKEGILLFYSRDVTKNTFKTTKGETFAWTEAQRALTGGVTCLLAYPPAATKAEPIGDCDVCIYGGTSGGVVAAVQAARMGKSVVLIEPGRHLGGMMAGGLSWSDVGSAERAKLFGGLAREVFERIGKHYGQDPRTVFDVTGPEGEGRSRKGVDFIRPPSLAFEPKVAGKVFTEVAREAGVQVRFGAALESVAKEGTRIKALKLNDGTGIAAKVFIDATYEGDLMALAGVSYTVGRESNEQYDETMNGVRGPEHGPSSGRFPVKVDPFVKPGDPASGLLPLIAGGAPEPVGSADKRIQSYNFRLCLTDDPANRVPLEPPPNYDAAQWELLGRYVEAMKAGGAKLTLRNFCKYDPLPNRKYDFNNRWPISTDLLGGADGWPEGTAKDRARIAKTHDDYLCGLFHFLRTDPRVPANVREETARFGLPKDEFTDNGNWPHQIYVREARRMVSDLVMTEHHIRNERVAPNPVSLATYPMDIHAVRRVYQDGRLYNEGFGGGGGRPAPIGYGAIVPKAAECENLFVTFALSASHAAFGSIRMEPVFMVSSQSAATAAVLAINDGVTVQAVDYAKLRTRLLADKQILDPSGAPPAAGPKRNARAGQPPGIVLDDTAATFTGTWAFSNKIAPLLGATYRTAERKQEATAVFTPEIPADGNYELRLLYTPASNRAQKARIIIRSAGGEKTVALNQRLECLEDGVPRSLGVFEFGKGKSGSIEISNQGADGYVIIDGLQIVPEETAKTERANGEDAGFPLKTVAATGPVKIPQPMLLKSAAKPQDVNGKSYDLVVIGGTPGGIACAVRAAREGLSVLLVNHTQHLGGFVTSGAGGWEAPYDGLRSPIYAEMLTGAAQYYAKTYGEGSPQHIASMPSQTSRAHIDRAKVEPRIAEMLFNEMVAKEKTLTVLLGHIVAKAECEGALLKSVTLQPMHGEGYITVGAEIFADAMYEGDLMASAGVKTQIGRESRTQYGEKHAGVIYTKRRHREPGQRGFSKDADEGRLNLRTFNHATADIVEGPHSGEADGSVMAYNYRLILTRDPANRIVVEKPANYDPALAKGPAGLSIVPNLPNQKIAWNGGRLIGPQNEYPGGDWATRERVSRHYLDLMLMRLWWVQNDSEASAADRKAFAGYGLAADEFPDNQHLPYEIYVREARRLVGRYVFREQDNVIAEGIARTPIHADSIAMTDWPMDSVACLPGDGIFFLAEESRPAQVPYRSILTQEIENLLVPVAISASHVGWGSIRLEPVWMQLGESAGHAAALAVKGKTTPTKVDPDVLIRKLANRRVMISFFNDVDVTSNDPRVAAAQYFGAKGFFASYDAKLDEPLTESVRRAWGEGLTALRGGKHDPMQLAKRVRQAEVEDSPKLERTRGEAVLSMWRSFADNKSAQVPAKAPPPPSESAATQANAKARVPLKVQPVRSSPAAEVAGKNYDLVVIGGTPGGIACAVRAAREGLSVLLVQHNRHIGGMLANALMQWDALYGGPRAPLFNEYAGMIEGYYRDTYGKNSSQYAQARYTQTHYPMSRFEPGVAEHLFNRLVSAERNITVLLFHYPTAIEREGAVLKTLTLREYGATRDITVTAATYVDATYEGDLAAVAKVPYRVGREGREEYGEPHAGKIFTNIGKESGPQEAKDGKLNLHLYGHVQGSVDPASPFTADGAIQAYNHRFCLSNEPGNIRLPEQPPGYNREEYVDYYRLSMGAGKLNGKASFNSAILPGENHAYPEASWPEREKIIARHTRFALGLMWFLQNDKSLSPTKREGYRRIGLPLDEFPDNDNIPYEMYVREARRLVGRHLFTEHDNRPATGLPRPPVHADSIAFTDWAMDSHDCSTDRRAGYAYDGKLILTEESRPAQIPYRCLLPQGVDNLLVPVCLSATHVAWGAVRLEPVWMMTGEAAGAAAALAKEHQTTPGKLDPDLLLRTLCKNRHFVTFFNDLQALADHPAMPAAQYFGTKGFFASYDAKLDEPLTEAVKAVWQEGVEKLKQGTFQPMQLVKAVRAAEAKPSPATYQKRGDFLLNEFSRLR